MLIFFLYFLCSCKLTSKMKLKKKEEKGEEEGSFEYAFKKTLVDFPLLCTKLQTQIVRSRLTEITI